MEKEKYQQLPPEEVKKFEEENMTDTQREMSEGREDLRDDILYQKEEFSKFFGENGHEWNRDKLKNQYLSKQEADKELDGIYKRTVDYIYKLAKEDNAEVYEHYDDRDKMATTCYIFSNGTVFCRRHHDAYNSGYDDVYYFKDKSTLISEIKAREDRKRKELEDSHKRSGDFIKRIK